MHPSSASFRVGNRARRRAFTLLEILLSLAIIGLLAGILIGGAASLLSDKPLSLDDIFWSSVQEARKCALRHQREVQLRFVNDKEKGRAFVVQDGSELKEFPVVGLAAAGDPTVDFLSNQKGGPTMLIAGMLVETKTVPAVTFYPDGTCTAFRLQISRSGTSYILSIDPWTCAAVLTPNDPNAPKF